MNSFAGLRILHVTDSVEPEFGGGTATRTTAAADQLAQRGAIVTVLSLEVRSGGTRKSVTRGVQYVSVPALFRRYLFPAAGFRTMRRLVGDSDVIHLMGHWSPLNLAISLFAQRASKPYVICPAGSLGIWGRSARFKSAFNRCGGNRMVARASGYVAVVEEEFEDFARHGIPPELITTIPNGVVTASADLSALDTSACKPYVLFLGRLHPIKGPDILLSAFLRVAGDLKYDIVFAGPDNGLQATLVQTARTSMMKDRIHFTGFVDGPIKDRLIRSAAAIVIPSRKEAMSMVALEAAAWARPVLATTECGLNQLLSSEHAEAVPASVDGLARGLLALQDRDLQERGIKFQKKVLSQFGWDHVAELYRDLYHRLVAA